MRPITNILVKRAPILPPSGGNIGNSNEFKPKSPKIGPKKALHDPKNMKSKCQVTNKTHKMKVINLF